MRSLNKFRAFRNLLLSIRRQWLVHIRGMDIHPGTSVSLSSLMIPGRKGAIAIGDGTMVAFKTLILAQRPDGSIDPVRIGRNCFIGGASMILPGVTIADECVIAAGAVVTQDVPPRSIVGGSPARILQQDIEVGRFGRFAYADRNEGRLYRKD